MDDDAAWFFDVVDQLARLSGLGDQLEAFFRTVDFEASCPDLDKAPAYADESRGGRPDYKQPVRLMEGIPDQRPPVLHALRWFGAFGLCVRRETA